MKYIVFTTCFFLFGCMPSGIPKNADKSTFQILNNNWGKDKDYIYNLMLEERLDSNPDNFKIINSNFVVDKNNLYNFIGEKIPGADPKTAKLLVNFYCLQKNKKLIFLSPNKFTKQDIIDIIDKDSLDSLYLFDKNNVYTSIGEKIEKADPTSFGYFGAVIEGTNKIFPMGYSRDKEHVFWGKNLIENIDIETFRPNLSSENIFDAEDKNAFYTADDSCIRKECKKENQIKIIRTLK